MSAKRKALSPRVRFEVFKRDGFTCTYCGAHPPAAVLHVDHILAVASGGSSDPDNLTTACNVCNGGKGARPLDVAPQSLADRASEVAEREAQLRGYAEVMEARRQRIEEDCWKVIEELEGQSETFRRGWFRSVKTFVERLGVPETLDAADIARAKFSYQRRKRFLYFCGICWRKIKHAEGGEG